MRSFINILFLLLVLILSACSSGIPKPAVKTQPGTGPTQSVATDPDKIKSDIRDVINSMDARKIDTTNLKDVARDILTKDHDILSDSGINKLTGNDPSAKSAGDILKNLRNATGLTPEALDSLKKVVSTLDQ